MKSKLIIRALLKFRNISVLFGLLSALVLEGGIPGQNLAGMHLTSLPIGVEAYGGAAGIYLLLVIQTLLSKDFHDNFNHKQKLKQIRELNNECYRLALDAKKVINQTYYQKLKKVMDDKSDIINSFFRGEKSYLKERIVEQTLNLVVSYTKLCTNFCMRSKELNGFDVSEIANRINTNSRKLSFTKDFHAAEDIKKVIEMDQRIIDRLKDEKRELERISAKLDYMESTVNMFKHQILSSIESEEMLEKLETAVNEASALDTVLHERRKNRINS